MRRPVQCAAQQESSSNFTEYCACCEEWLSWLILVTHQTSSTTRGATGVTLQLHQILPLPRRMSLMIDPRHTSNVQYNARSNRSHPPTSCHYKNDSHDWSSSDMKRPVQSAEQPKSPSNFTKYSLETSSTISGASGVTFQLHQIVIVLLPGKMILMINPGLTWNVQYNARSNRSHRPTPANVAKAAKNGFYDWSSWHKKRPVQCAEQQGPPSNFDKYCACREKRLDPRRTWNVQCNARSNRSHPPTSPVTHETSFTLRGPTEVTLQHHQILRLLRKMTFQNSREIFRNAGPADPRMIRAWSDHEPVTAAQPRLLLSRSARAFCIQKYNISRSGCHSEFHRILRLPRKVTVELQILPLPRKLSVQLDCNFIKYCACHKQLTAPSISTKIKCATWMHATSWNIERATKSRLFFDSTILWLYFSLTLLFFDSAILLLYNSFTL